MKEIEIILRNPLNKDNKLSYYIDVAETEFNIKWINLLKKNLINKMHLEKNYCFLGWSKSPRNGELLCEEINKAIKQINYFNQTREWQKSKLEDYHINDYFSLENVLYSENEHPLGWLRDDEKNLALTLKHEKMNQLHRYFEDLQGEAWNISKYYKLADYETKYSIRQLNILCHELECWAKSNRQMRCAPEWQRPSQITTFLNAPRHDLEPKDYDLFYENSFDRVLGGVYLHWAQVGKTPWEVFCDENGADVNEATCSAINSLKFYTGEFDIEWGRDVTYDSAIWHKEKMEEFYVWLQRNRFDVNDPKLCLGYIKIGQVNIEKSFATKDYFDIIDVLSQHLDIYKIKVDDVEGVFDYVWSDDNYKQMQIDFLRPGYDWSKNNA